MEQWRRILPAMSLVVAIAMLSHPSAWSDDDNDNSGIKKLGPAAPSNARPDLRVKFEGFSPANLRHTVTFRVTNDGAASSTTGIKARLETLAPESSNVSESEDVGGLLPGQSKLIYYGIGACKGQKVRATVSDQLDLNTSNDSDVVELNAAACGTTSGPSAPMSPNLDSSRITSAGISVIPEHLQKGEHTLEFPSSVFREQ